MSSDSQLVKATTETQENFTAALQNQQPDIKNTSNSLESEANNLTEERIGLGDRLEINGATLESEFAVKCGLQTVISQSYNEANHPQAKQLALITSLQLSLENYTHPTHYQRLIDLSFKFDTARTI